MATFKAYAVKEPKGKAELVDLPIPELKEGEVLVDVICCAICHSDLSLIDGDWGPFSAYPNQQISGHEVSGKIAAVGPGVTDVSVGQFVGVGWQRGSCLDCNYCAIDEGECCIGPTGMLPTCAAGFQGGFAEKVVVQSKYAFPLPDAIEPEYLGPLMCGGITAYKPIVQYAKPGDMVGVVGLGGIGCMGVMLAKAYGCSVTVFSTSKAKEAQAKEIGADKFVVTSDPESLKAAENSCQMILYTPNVCGSLDPFISCLAMKGKLAFIGAITDGPKLPIFGPPIMKDLLFAGSHIGGPKLIKEMLKLVAEKKVKVPVNVHPFSEINECLDKMRSNAHTGRFVLKW